MFKKKEKQEQGRGRLVSIVCRSGNHVIGNKGQIPWTCQHDMDFFKKTTMGHTLIMGRRTFESLPHELEGRKTIVITRDPDKLKARYPKSAAVFVDEMVFPNEGEIFYVCGGSTIYQMYAPYVNEILMSTIYVDDVEGDCFMAPSGNTYIMHAVEQSEVKVTYTNNKGETITTKAPYDIIRYTFNSAIQS